MLNLAENPISSPHGGLPHYRMCVLHFLPWLEKLDDVDVTPEEASTATAIELNQLVHMVDSAASFRAAEHGSSPNRGQKKAHV